MSAKADRIDGRQTHAAEPAGQTQSVPSGLLQDVTWDVLSEKINDLVVMADVTGAIFYVSPACRNLGYTQQELIGRSPADFVHPDDLAHFEANAATLFVDGRVETLADREHRYRRKDGSWVWLEGNPSLIHGPDGKPMGLVNVFRDVTDKVELRARLREALAQAEQAATVKAEFLANMSHEIRTPLTAVIGFASLLAERSDLDEAAQSQIGRIAGAGRALLAVVNDVLDFSKLEAGEITIRRRPACPEQAAREVLDMFALQAGSKGLALRFDAAVGLPRSLVLDEERLRQILINLVGNAVKFTDRGRVSLALSYDADARLIVEVSDTGPGISAAAKGKLFQRFSQIDGSSARTKGGTGLGLAICQGLAQAMGGAVSVTSRVGRGSTFRLVLPAPEGVADAATGTRASDLEGLHGARVLVVDDNPVNRELARTVLESVGVEVTEAHDGREAVEVAQRLPFDAILMDLRMPGLDGRAATAAIRLRPGPNQNMPVLAFSADGIMDLGAPQNACFQGVVLKPTTPADLFRALLRVLGEAPAIEAGGLLAAAS